MEIPAGMDAMDLETCEQLQMDEREVLESIYPDQITFQTDAGPLPGSNVTLHLPIALPRAPRNVIIRSSVTPISISSAGDLHLQLRTLPSLDVDISLPREYPLYRPPSVLSISSPANSLLPSATSTTRSQGRSEGQREGKDQDGQSYLPRHVIRQVRRKLHSDWAELAGVTFEPLEPGDNSDAEEDRQPRRQALESPSGDGSGVLWTWLDWLASGDSLEACGVVGEDDAIELVSSDPPSLAQLLQAHDDDSLQADFSASTFTCGICFDSKKGRLCVAVGCERGCVFCADCLRDGWALAIKEGNVGGVACPGFECTKDRAREDARAREGAGSAAGGIGTTEQAVEDNASATIDSTTSSSSSASSIDVALVERVVGKPLAERYVWLVEKKRVENDPRYMMCPLPHCQAPVPPPANPVAPTLAPTKRFQQVFRLPSAANAAPTPEVSPLAAAEAEEAARQRQVDQWDRYRQCPTCRFSFCRYCQATWHGPHLPCKIAGADSFLIKYMSLEEGDPARATFERRYGKKNLARLVAEYEENEANRQWIESHTQTCPSCSSRIEHSHGCQHMSCATCGSHFCFRCGTSLRPSDPYVHYNDPRSPCYGKLFDAAEIARFDRIMAAGGGEEQVRDDVPWAAIGGGLDDIIDMI